MKLNKKTVANVVYWTIMVVLCLLAYIGICFNLFCIFTWKGVLIAHLVAIFVAGVAILLSWAEDNRKER